MTLESLVLPKALWERNFCFLWWCCRWISQFFFNGLQGWHNNSSISYVIAKISQRTGVDNIFYVCQDRRSLEKLFPTPSWVVFLNCQQTLSQWPAQWLTPSEINFQLTPWLANLSSTTVGSIFINRSLWVDALSTFVAWWNVVWLSEWITFTIPWRLAIQWKACRKSFVVILINNSRWTAWVSSQMKMHT